MSQEEIDRSPREKVVFRRYVPLSDEERKELGFLPESEEIRLGLCPASLTYGDGAFLKKEDTEIEL